MGNLCPKSEPIVEYISEESEDDQQQSGNPGNRFKMSMVDLNDSMIGSLA